MPAKYTLEDWRAKEKELEEKLESLGDRTGRVNARPFKAVKDQLCRCRQRIKFMEQVEQDRIDAERDQLELEDRVAAALPPNADASADGEFWYTAYELRKREQEAYNEEGELI